MSWNDIETMLAGFAYDAFYNQNETSKKNYFTVFDYAMDQGFAFGSSFKSLPCSVDLSLLSKLTTRQKKDLKTIEQRLTEFLDVKKAPQGQINAARKCLTRCRPFI